MRARRVPESQCGLEPPRVSAGHSYRQHQQQRQAGVASASAAAASWCRVSISSSGTLVSIARGWHGTSSISSVPSASASLRLMKLPRPTCNQYGPHGALSAGADNDRPHSHSAARRGRMNGLAFDQSLVPRLRDRSPRRASSRCRLACRKTSARRSYQAMIGAIGSQRGRRERPSAAFDHSLGHSERAQGAASGGLRS